MNKKVSKQFKDIKDIYLLQCICTEQNDEIEKLHSIIKEAREYIDNDFNRFDCFGSMKVSMEMNYKREELLEILDKVNRPTVKPYKVEDNIQVGNVFFVGGE